MAPDNDIDYLQKRPVIVFDPTRSNRETDPTGTLVTLSLEDIDKYNRRILERMMLHPPIKMEFGCTSWPKKKSEIPDAWLISPIFVWY